MTPGRVAISAPISLTRTSEFLSLMNPLPTQMLGEFRSVEIQASTTAPTYSNLVNSETQFLQTHDPGFQTIWVPGNQLLDRKRRGRGEGETIICSSSKGKISATPSARRFYGLTHLSCTRYFSASGFPKNPGTPTTGLHHGCVAALALKSKI